MNKIERICKYCGKKFFISPSRANDKNIKRGIFCSRECKDKHLIGKPTWNKGKKGRQKNHNISGLKLGLGWNFKNGKASYTALHQWINRRLGKANKCNWCGVSIDAGAKIHWANISHEYKWNIDDFMPLCSKCHGKYDSNINRGSIKKIYDKR